ncbi:unnamed protein product [Fusarium venenatum]|uniref:Uncharacterized protein n=1 Tax=Fusarium venenatum TaxID=56646 RepID=A0A2L2SR06_9HYPO|nr:uncharacterized protein FVRRES_13297 [Fusarium venenatum]CEI40834.1 unnamed protein product [Fusarium venenatum]
MSMGLSAPHSVLKHGASDGQTRAGGVVKPHGCLNRSEDRLASSDNGTKTKASGAKILTESVGDVEKARVNEACGIY